MLKLFHPACRLSNRVFDGRSQILCALFYLLRRVMLPAKHFFFKDLHSFFILFFFGLFVFSPVADFLCLPPFKHLCWIECQVPQPQAMLLQGRQLIRMNDECWDINLTNYNWGKAERDHQYNFCLKERKAVLCIFQERSPHMFSKPKPHTLTKKQHVFTKNNNTWNDISLK